MKYSIHLGNTYFKQLSLLNSVRLSISRYRVSRHVMQKAPLDCNNPLQVDVRYYPLLTPSLSSSLSPSISQFVLVTFVFFSLLENPFQRLDFLSFEASLDRRDVSAIRFHVQGYGNLESDLSVQLSSHSYIRKIRKHGLNSSYDLVSLFYEINFPLIHFYYLFSYRCVAILKYKFCTYFFYEDSRIL